MLLVSFIYFSLISFLGISFLKVWNFHRLPLHGRMELYPIPKEKGFAHGGSYYEEALWWEKPRHKSIFREILEMLKEMLFIKKLFENKRSLWWFSYAFHFGIYLMAFWTVLLFINEVSGIIEHLISVIGVLGYGLTTAGVLALLGRRIFDPVLRKYTSPQEYFNIVFLLLVLLSGIAAWGQDFGIFAGPRKFMQAILAFQPLPANSGQVLHLILLGLMFIYIPLSKMSHYIGKYYSFHKVLWENEPNTPGSAVEDKVKELTGRKAKTSWGALHIITGATDAKKGA